VGTAPRTVAGYRLEGELGRGGMGVVYRARGPDGAPVALKILDAWGGALEDVERFLREARATAALDHPGIVRVRASGGAAAHPWLALELVRGDLARSQEGLPASPRAAQIEADFRLRAGDVEGARRAARRGLRLEPSPAVRAGLEGLLARLDAMGAR